MSSLHTDSSLLLWYCVRWVVLFEGLYFTLHTEPFMALRSELVDWPNSHWNLSPGSGQDTFSTSAWG